MLLTKWFTESLRSINERLNGLTEKQTDFFIKQESHGAHISGIKRDIGTLTERQDIAAAERRGIERAHSQAIADIRAAISGIQTRLQNLGSMSVEQDHGIESIDARCNDFVKAIDALRESIDALRERTTQLEIASGENLEARANIQTEMTGALTESQKAGNLAWSIAAKHGAQGLDIKANAENIERMTKRLDDIHYVLNVTIKEDRARDDAITEFRGDIAANRARLDQFEHARNRRELEDPAEFVQYTHAADLAEVVRKIVRIELNSFDFSPRIDIAVRDAAVRALTNMTDDRRQFGSFAMWGGGTGGSAHGSNAEYGGPGGSGFVGASIMGGGGSGRSIRQRTEPKQSTIHVEQDADGKPVNFTSDGKGKKPD